MTGTLVSSLNRWNEGTFVPQSFLWVEAVLFVGMPFSFLPCSSVC